MSPTDLTNINKLVAELSGAVTNLAGYHAEMQLHCQYYEKSAFYPSVAGQSPTQRNQLPDNFLQVFADKNIHYTSAMPEFKIPATPEDRDAASMREKIIYAVWRKSGGRMLQKKWSRDATKKSVAISEVVFDLDERCVRVNRYDPRFVFWKMSNGNDEKVTAFWAVFPITKQEAIDTYGITPKKDVVANNMVAKLDPYFNSMDGQEWYTMAIRWDSKYRVAFIGDAMIEEPHEHGFPFIPVDVCAPFPTERRNRFGDFYLDRLIAMQAELNDTVRRRSNIVKRMSNPIIWGRNIQLKSYDDVKAALKNAETGVLGLGKDGEVGILQLQEIKMLYEHETALKSDMQRMSGFAAASFGESVGANTSGGALEMYFTPTQKHIDDQNISWEAFYESINAKILAAYDIFGATGEEFALDGYFPKTTLASVTTGGQRVQLPYSGKLKFKRDVINGNYTSIAKMPPVIPRNELAEKQFWVTSAKDKVISRTTAYDKIGIESPEDEKALLIMEQQEPFLNPDGINTILGAAQQQAPAALPVGNPAPGLPAPMPPQLVPERV